MRCPLGRSNTSEGQRLCVFVLGGAFNRGYFSFSAAWQPLGLYAVGLGPFSLRELSLFVKGQFRFTLALATP